MYYIKGGDYKAMVKGKIKIRPHEGCRPPKNPPQKDMPFEIPFNMFYANPKGFWECPVCFLDVSKSGHAYGRAYLITDDQLVDIKGEEGNWPHWYGNSFYLGEVEDYPAYTLTCEQDSATFFHRSPYKDVDDGYRNVLRRGLKETFPSLSEAGIEAYLNSR